MTERLKSCCIPTSEGFKDAELVTIPQSTEWHPLDTEFVSLDGGWFHMGAEDSPHPRDGEGPVRHVFVSPFSISRYSVTYREFEQFIKATGYKTLAERSGFSFVFYSHLNRPDDYDAPVHAPWWRKVEGACWRDPYGPDSTCMARGNHPVVHIALADALAFCAWTGTRLLTEAEWEFAARGGLVGQPYPWGNQPDSSDAPRLNVWRGEFPKENLRRDNYDSTVPVDSFDPNAYGLYNMTGNVWELTADRFTALHSPRPQKDPRGPLNGKTMGRERRIILMLCFLLLSI